MTIEFYVTELINLQMKAKSDYAKGMKLIISII